MEKLKKEANGLRYKGKSLEQDFDSLVKSGNNGQVPQPQLISVDGGYQNDYKPVLRAFENGVIEVVRKFTNINSRKFWAGKVFDFYKSKFDQGWPFTKEMYDFMKANGQNVEDYYK